MGPNRRAVSASEPAPGTPAARAKSAAKAHARAKAAAAAAKGGDVANTSASASASVDPRTLLDQARAAMDAMDPPAARRLARQALAAAPEGSPSHGAVLECLGLIEMEAAAAHMSAVDAAPADNDDDDGDDAELAGLEPAARAEARAERYLRAAVAAADGAGTAASLNPAVYLYLGQMLEGEEALMFYQRGVDRLVTELEVQKGSDEAAALRRRISSALCSMTEIYMTDLCDLPEAEQRCEALVHRALEVDPAGPEPLQTLASVRLS
ncbi:hypothetical protein HK405_015496, partial [Cladochytrium tenue]